MEAEIEDESAMPAAVGWHPWLRRGGSDPRLLIDADAVLETRALIPTGRVLPLEGRVDLRTGPLLGPRRLDHTYVGARSPAIVTWPDLELRLEFLGIDTIVVFTPPGAFCVEPQTAWPNALGFADGADRVRAGARTLGVGERLHAAFVIRWNRSSDQDGAPSSLSS
jgi:galactose mutarotase-like enzyme